MVSQVACSKRLFDIADHRLFTSITSDKNHVLYKLLPPKVKHDHNMRKRAHDFVPPFKNSIKVGRIQFFAGYCTRILSDFIFTS